MKRLGQAVLAALLLAGLYAAFASAQVGPGSPGAVVVATCGSGVTYTAGQTAPLTQNTSGQLCVSS
jgi:hypothetical protein